MIVSVVCPSIHTSFVVQPKSNHNNNNVRDNSHFFNNTTPANPSSKFQKYTELTPPS